MAKAGATNEVELFLGEWRGARERLSGTKPKYDYERQATTKAIGK